MLEAAKAPSIANSFCTASHIVRSTNEEHTLLQQCGKRTTGPALWCSKGEDGEDGSEKGCCVDDLAGDRGGGCVAALDELPVHKVESTGE